MPEPMRFGVIGAGIIGTTHAEAIGSLPGAELVAVCDQVLERAQRLADRYGARAFTDTGTMLGSERLDIVTVCTPSGLHAEGACAAMRAGCHVLVEKPMETTPAKIDEMLRVQEETGVKLGCVFQHRFDPAAQRVHGLLQEGAFGKVVLGTAQLALWRSQKYYDSGGWRGTWALDGGGVLMNQTIHQIDLLLWLMGPVKSVRGYAETLAHHIETEDTATASLLFTSGALGAIVATTGAYPGVATRVELFGDRGSTVIENDELTFLHLARDEAEPAGDFGIWPPPRHEISVGGASANPTGIGSAGHRAHIADMIAAVGEDRPPLVDGHSARIPVELILAIYESARTGREIVLG